MNSRSASVPVWIHPTAEVAAGASIGPGTRIWHHAQVRERAVVGSQCILGKGVYIDVGVRLGDRVKVQNGASIYRGVTVEDGVFVGPGALLINDRQPRAINPDGTLKTEDDWVVSPTVVRTGASIGAAAVVLPGVTIGRWALVAAGAVATRDVPDFGLVMGVPARLAGHVCPCGVRLSEEAGRWRCPACGWETTV